MNINDRVKVTLTAHGAAIYNRRYEEMNLPEKFQPTIVKEGYELNTQLWCLMQDFGPYISVAMISPFVGNHVELL